MLLIYRNGMILQNYIVWLHERIKIYLNNSLENKTLQKTHENPNDPVFFIIDNICSHIHVYS